MNLGKTAWGHRPKIDDGGPVLDEPGTAATLVGRWLSLADGTMSPATASARVKLPAGLAPRVTTDAVLAISVPAAPGDYLLVLDVITPDNGSLIAAGVEPTIVRVAVVP